MRIRITVEGSRDYIILDISEAEFQGLKERAHAQAAQPQYHPKSATWTVGDHRFTDEWLVRERENAQKRYERPSYKNQNHQSFFMDDSFFQFFRGADDGFRDRAGNPGRPTPPKSPKEDTLREQLRKMAGVSVVDAQGMSSTKLKRMAMRRCHPDSGGTHKEWLNLVDLCKRMGIPV